MNLQRAYDLLKERWPGRSFCIGLDVWHHKHLPKDQQCVVEWAIYDHAENIHFRGPTLESALEFAIGCDADLAMVERSIGDVAS